MSKQSYPEWVKKGAIGHHHKGFYSVVVYDTFVDDSENQWVVFFLISCCDNTFKQCKDAFAKQMDGGSVTHDELTGQQHWLKGFMNVNSLPRFLESYQEKMPDEIKTFEPKVVSGPIPDRIVIPVSMADLTPIDSIPEPSRDAVGVRPVPKNLKPKNPKPKLTSS